VQLFDETSLTLASQGDFLDSPAQAYTPTFSAALAAMLGAVRRRGGIACQLNPARVRG
jgi:hypothetical protein